MKKFEVKNQLKAFYVLASVLLSLQSFATCKKYVSIEEALKKKHVDASFLSTGDYSANCINAEITNYLYDTAYILVEAGRRFDTENNYEQDILVTKENRLKIGPRAKIKTLIYGFCCQASNSSPSAKSRFRVGSMADSILVKVACYINKHHIDVNTQQNTVWAFSDNRPLHFIPQSFDASSDSLLQFCTKLKNCPMPWCYFQFARVNGSLVSNIKTVFATQFSYQKKTGSKLYVAIFDSLGNEIKRLADYNFSPKNELSFKFKVPLINWKKGNYILKVIENNHVELEKTFEV